MAPTVTDIGMTYRFLGNSGLLVSTFGFGCMLEKDSEVDKAYEIHVHAFKHGVNFWDTAEAYGKGSSERVVGLVIQRGIEEGVWTREDLVLSTKIFFGTQSGPNAQGLSRKHIVEGAKASLKRLDVGYVDVLFLHRPEKNTPIEEVVRAMNFVIDQGAQPQYNLVNRTRIEVEFASLFKKYKLGLTTWSPLAFGLLTGKYANGFPEGTRLANEFYRNRFDDLEGAIAGTEKLRPIADELGCTLAQLALAWCASNENVSTVLLGAKTLEQLDENLKAFPFVAKMTPEIKARINQAMPFQYRPSVRDRFYTVRETDYV